jgi:serine protease Do
MGSGVVIDDKGHILTNHHVVAGADDVEVTFIDGKKLKGKIVGTDPMTDLAVLEVDGATAKPAEFGSSEQMRVGEWVMAIGNPFGLDHSVTVGVLSAKGRYGFAPGKLEDFLQTDASINPGNSGGPLVNIRGEVVGINTMIAGIGTGVGFAVSESIARPIAKQLIEHGKVTRPFIGIVMQSLTPDLVGAIGANAPDEGALVSKVQAGSPADKAGILVGDIIIRVDGKPTTTSRDVQREVFAGEVGQNIKVTVWRNGKERVIDVRAAEMPTEPTKSSEHPSREEMLGLGLETLTPELADRLDIDRATKGVVVTAVRPGTIAAEVGVRPGDVLVEIDRSSVTTAEEAVKKLAQQRAGGHLVRVQRGDAALFIVLPDPRKEGT